MTNDLDLGHDDLGEPIALGDAGFEPILPDADQEPDWGAPAEPLWHELSTGEQVVLVDTDHSGAWDHAAVDLDGDGIPEVVLSLQANGVMLLFDTEGDGQFDHSELVALDELAAFDPELYELVTEGLELTAPADAEYVPAEVDYQAVTEENPHWFQQAQNGFCVPASVAQIVASYTGVPFADESAFVELANDLGLWKVGPDGVPGMTMEGGMYLLEHAGVPASVIYSANLDMLEAFEDDGHGIILFVNSSEVWGESELGPGAADHALVLEDIDRVNGVAILSDPGHPDGSGWTVPLEVLEDAWADSNNQMIVTEQPATPSVADTPMVATEAPEVVEAAAGQGFTPTVDGQPLDGIELHSPIPDAMQWLVQRPWVLLPIAIGASRLLSR
jgi:hypothetical protein